jgi:hypothetical protein
MLEQTLNIHFQGICVHFRGIVPGVPHRVVLPQTDTILMGALQIGDGLAVRYTIGSHFPQIVLQGGADASPVNAGHYVVDGMIMDGVRLEIVNANNGLTYTGGFDHVLQLTKYMDNYRPSTEVVSGGRANAYFDFFNGIISSENHGDACHALIQLQTDGAPVLQITPLVGEPSAPTPELYQIPLGTTTDLWFTNFGENCGVANEFDFLLNYLTAEGGIPRDVKEGFPLEDVQTCTAMESMTVGAATQRTTGLKKMVGTSLSCSDSRYP